MSRIVAGIKLKVQCADGRTYEDVTLAIEGNRRVYQSADGTELNGIECIDEFNSVLPPMMLAALLGNCKEGD